MLESVTRKSLEFLVRELNLSDKYEIDRMRYGLELIIGESIKFIFLFFLAISMGKVLELLIILSMLLTIRTTIGGSHAKSFEGCLIMSIITYLALIVADNIVGEVNFNFKVISIIVSILIICTVKKTNRLMKIKKIEASKIENIKFRIMLILIVLISVFLVNLVYSKGMTILLLTQNFIVIDYLIMKGEKRDEKEI